MARAWKFRRLASHLLVFLIMMLLHGCGLILSTDSLGNSSSYAVIYDHREVFPVDSLASSCTIFTATIGDTVLFGNNEDFPLSGTFIWLMPAQEVQLPSETIPIHGAIFFGFDANDHPVDGYPQGGMNDQGLCCDGNSLPDAPLNPYPERDTPYAYPFYQILWECATVNDTIAWFESHYVGTSLPGQFHFADATGDAVVVSAGSDGELAYTRIGNATRLVSTNFNLANPSNGDYPCNRYLTACSLLDEVSSEDELTIDVCRTILAAVHQESVTAYSNIFNPVTRKIYIYQNHDFSAVVELNLDEELERVVPGAEGVVSENPVLVKAIRIGDLFAPPISPFIGVLLIGACLIVGILVVSLLVLRYKRKFTGLSFVSRP